MCTKPGEDRPVEHQAEVKEAGERVMSAYFKGGNGFSSLPSPEYIPLCDDDKSSLLSKGTDVAGRLPGHDGVQGILVS